MSLYGGKFEHRDAEEGPRDDESGGWSYAPTNRALPGTAGKQPDPDEANEGPPWSAHDGRVQDVATHLPE